MVDYIFRVDHIFRVGYIFIVDYNFRVDYNFIADYIFRVDYKIGNRRARVLNTPPPPLREVEGIMNKGYLPKFLGIKNRIVNVGKVEVGR